MLRTRILGTSHPHTLSSVMSVICLWSSEITIMLATPLFQSMFLHSAGDTADTDRQCWRHY
jgi:hypothetical protein